MLLRYRDAVKSNTKDLKETSGLTGGIQAIWALEHGLVPPNAKFENII